MTCFQKGGSVYAKFLIGIKLGLNAAPVALSRLRAIFDEFAYGPHADQGS